MKNICIVDYDMSVVGGVENVTTNLANEFTTGYNVFVLSLYFENDNCPYEFNKKVKFTKLNNGIRNNRLRREKRTVNNSINRFIRSNKIDYLIIQGHITGYLCGKIKYETKTIFCDHGALMNAWNDKNRVFMRWLNAQYYDYTVTLTERSKKDYHKKLLVSNKKLVCIPNWIDNKKERSSEYNINSKKIISAGRLSEEKGFDQLMYAFSKINKKHPEWKIDIYGDGESYQQIEDLIEKLDLSGQVNLCGLKRDISMLYREYAFYALPSYKEGYPIVLLEAKYNRLPIISFDIITGPKEIVRNNIDGILVEEKNIDEFAKAMEYLISNTEIRKKMSDKSQENIEAFYKESVISKWYELLK